MGWAGPLTHRQHLAWVAFLEDDWNQPSRSDHYLMQIDADIRRVGGMFARHPPAIRLEDCKLKFTTQSEQAKPAFKMTPEQKAALSRACWFTAVGYKPEGNGNGPGDN